ncbi:hypothetical protein DXC89_03585 [Prevotella disiens]|uniref:Uncharacterized protein n=1 Tax=Prevotella disiens TaxID=28130 RepID=A0A3E4QLG3_9BACT|nr:hypothetical protein DXC89_03585 [Prevotella disiens]
MIKSVKYIKFLYSYNNIISQSTACFKTLAKIQNKILKLQGKFKKCRFLQTQGYKNGMIIGFQRLPFYLFLGIFVE